MAAKKTANKKKTTGNTRTSKAPQPKKSSLSDPVVSEIRSISILILLLILNLCMILHNRMGIIGRTIYKAGIGMFGFSAFLLCLFALVIGVIVSRTPYWYAAVGVVLVAVLIGDRKLLLKTDYVLLLTFLCFFVFSSSVAANPHTAAFLQKVVAGREYLVSILISQVISNVPAAIVLYPFSQHTGALLYGLDSAGLCTLIGSLASVINYRIYVREYPGRGKDFIRVFTLVSWAFFLIVVVPGFLLSRWPFF